MDFDEVADELYGLPPDEFMAARAAREREARGDGDRALAAAIRKLGKPSAAAWACNVLVRHHRDEIEDLVELGGLLREAQQNLEGDQLRALDVQRRQLVGALTRQARALAHRLGHPVGTGAAQQVEATLRAALSGPDAGEALLGGRLTSPLSYTGMGMPDRPDLRVVPPPEAGEEPARRSARGRPRRDDEDRRERARREAEERRRRELAQARRAAEDAEDAAREAAEAAEGEKRQVDELVDRQEALLARVGELTAELARTRKEATRLDGERSRAERRHEAAERRRADAARTRDRARAALERLERR